jgi:hypothetical protein
MLLAHQTMSHDKGSLRVLILARWLALGVAAVQSCVMMHRGLEHVPSLPW